MQPLARFIAINLIQIAFLLAFAPLLEGVLARLEEIIQGKHGPSIFQPYYDLWKLFGKDEIVSRESTWIFRFAPIVHFAMPIFVVMLIPALTDYPLFLAFAGDMIAVGFLFSASGFFVALAAMDTGNVYGPIGASRTRMVGFLAEPVYMVAFFALSFVANSTIPYTVNASWALSWASMLQPAHLLVFVAFLLLVLADEKRLPVDNPGGKAETAMIGHSNNLEYSGTGAALMKWGSAMKFMAVLIVFLNVILTPWGLAATPHWGDVLMAIPKVLGKMLIFLIVLAVIETTLAKLRLFRISEFLASAFVICIFAMGVRLVGVG
ncbi:MULTISPECIES: respiratory chain complex I subunit 1 family protein [Alcaligenaceae]|uniref:Formate hydrogenlyase subunit 4 n=1 Tax=Eoetvoesiella caeni TaxID=645616 RepID=A0A366H6S8_9BURK|nr:NADH-quinone oxidoreductase subunit H [Eoetvoesiella caeni]MCI2810343.1 NADH-quinone oxidoreductase subunit H [Eoetvoesiella caeni]NYT54712.1 NADH-quinone oxidoreductase subunit H [Eoetvoesiella caeni]RBP37119.1 formate hydrogenlyase subunit 4 [Eoetvoesiella caeni]